MSIDAVDADVFFFGLVEQMRMDIFRFGEWNIYSIVNIWCSQDLKHSHLLSGHQGPLDFPDEWRIPVRFSNDVPQMSTFGTDSDLFQVWKFHMTSTCLSVLHSFSVRSKWWWVTVNGRIPFNDGPFTREWWCGTGEAQKQRRLLQRLMISQHFGLI